MTAKKAPATKATAKPATRKSSTTTAGKSAARTTKRPAAKVAKPASGKPSPAPATGKRTAGKATAAAKQSAAKKPSVAGPVIAMAARTAAAAADGGPRFWLMKSEPEAFSIDDLQRQGTTPWEGVRNYRARNHMRDDMRVGDGVLFYHSSTNPPGVVGLARVASAPYPDPSALDPANPAFDPDSKPDAPRWILVDVAFVEKFAAGVSLDALRDDPALAGMLVAQKGQRLSVQPVERAHFEHIVRRAGSRCAASILGAPASA